MQLYYHTYMARGSRKGYLQDTMFLYRDKIPDNKSTYIYREM